MTTQRLYIALAVYAFLVVIGTGLTTGDVRLVLWVFFAGLGLKSYISWAKQRLDE